MPRARPGDGLQDCCSQLPDLAALPVEASGERFAASFLYKIHVVAFQFMSHTPCGVSAGLCTCPHLLVAPGAGSSVGPQSILPLLPPFLPLFIHTIDTAFVNFYFFNKNCIYLKYVTGCLYICI